MGRIVRVDVGLLDYALVGEFKFFKTPARPTVLARLIDDAGAEGWGQSVPVETWTYETVESVETTLRNYLAPAVLGADPSDLADVHARMERAIKPSFSVGQPLAKAAIDLACYDLWGRGAGKSAAALLGGVKCAEIRLSWTINATSLEKAEAQLEAGRVAGYGSFNVKVGPPQTPDYDLDLIRRVTRFAPDGFHWCDANTSYDLGTARRMAKRFADAGLKALESPLPPNRIRDYQSLRKDEALPILMDEGIVSPVEAEEFMALGMMDGIAMKVARCGGLWHASRIVTLLETYGLKLFASGLTDAELSMAASAHLFAWAGLAAPAALNGPQYLAGRGTEDEAFRAKGDIMRVPAGPGLGVAIGPRARQAMTMAAEA
jgi:L-alanine-DL-glutamate epimerase-like enolase superfamily enzyme